MRRIFLLLVLASAFIVTSCGGGGSGGGSSDGGGTTIDASQYYYQPQPGDTIIYTETIDDVVKPSIEYTYTPKAAPLDTKYTMAPLSGDSYLQEDENNDESDGPEHTSYYTLSGDEILCDYLLDPGYPNLYSVFETDGDEEPALVTIGHEYTSTVTESFYNYDDPDLANLRVTTATITPIGFEDVTVEAGTYTCLEFSLSAALQEGSDQATLTTIADVEGNLWYGEDNAGLIKSQLTMTTHDDPPLTFTIIDELFSFAQDESSMLVPGSSLVGSTGNSISIGAFMGHLVKQVRFDRLNNE